MALELHTAAWPLGSDETSTAATATIGSNPLPVSLLAVPQTSPLRRECRLDRGDAGTADSRFVASELQYLDSEQRWLLCLLQFRLSTNSKLLPP